MHVHVRCTVKDLNWVTCKISAFVCYNNFIITSDGLGEPAGSVAADVFALPVFTQRDLLCEFHQCVYNYRHLDLAWIGFNCSFARLCVALGFVANVSHTFRLIVFFFLVEKYWNHMTSAVPECGIYYIIFVLIIHQLNTKRGFQTEE